MGIAHGYACHAVFLPLHQDWLIHRPVPGSLHRNQSRFQNRASHVDTHLLHRPAALRLSRFFLYCQFQKLHLPGADYTDVVRIRQSFVIYILSHTADSVSAHLRPGAVGIVHFHLEIGIAGRVDKNHPVPADAEMSVAEPPYQFRLLRIGNVLLKAVYIDIIIAAAVHFRKFHFCSSPPNSQQVFLNASIFYHWRPVISIIKSDMASDSYFPFRRHIYYKEK